MRGRVSHQQSDKATVCRESSSSSGVWGIELLMMVSGDGELSSASVVGVMKLLEVSMVGEEPEKPSEISVSCVMSKGGAV